MNEIITTPTGTAVETAYTPIVARTPIRIRPAVLGDLLFMDRMQKAHSRELGFLPTMALEGKIKLGQVLVAERREGEGVSRENEAHPSSLTPHASPLTPSPVGYLIAADRYQKRDEIGYVTQMCVTPEYRRSLVAAQLLQAQFDRSAYGCKLYSCWCAQDLKANEFWEAMGFTAIAFRTGSMKKGKKDLRLEDEAGTSPPQSQMDHRKSKMSPRVHIFWQKRIRAGDEATAWWYPSQTGGGVLREDRLVFPIMPGVQWRDVGPIVLEEVASTVGRDEIPPSNVDAESHTAGLHPALPKKPKRAKIVAPPPPPVLRSPRLPGSAWFEHEGILVQPPTPEKPAKAVKEKPPKVKTTIDPRLTAMSRELRDQWTERAAAIVSPIEGKHDVKRISHTGTIVEPRRIERAA